MEMMQIGLPIPFFLCKWPTPQFFMHNFASRLTDSAEIPVPMLAKAMCQAGIRGSSGLTSSGVGSPPSDKFTRKDGATGTVTIVNNSEAKRLAKET